jgi:2-polyprenyl-6-methoxyphenol hydroxylase-like FAD-dependent oxidoreductase
MNTHPTVLISGAGVGGPTLAYWLAERGFRPTVVERAAGLRSSGNPVDVRGPKQNNVAAAAALMVPATRTGIAARNLATRLWPAAATVGWVRRHIAPRRGPAQAAA